MSNPASAPTKAPRKRTRSDAMQGVDDLFAGLRLSDQVRQGIRALVVGNAATVSEAARQAGCRRESISRALSRPKTAAAIKKALLSHLHGIVAIKAALRLEQLIGAKSEEIGLKASTTVLEEAGLLSSVADPRLPASTAPLLTIIMRHHQPEQFADVGTAPTETTITIAAPIDPPMREMTPEWEAADIAARISARARDGA